MPLHVPWLLQDKKKAKNAFDRTHPLHTFSIGIQGAPDLIAAREVAHQLGTVHHEFHFTVEEGIDAVYDLVYHLESYEQVTGLPRLVWTCVICAVLHALRLTVGHCPSRASVHCE